MSSIRREYVEEMLRVSNDPGMRSDDPHSSLSRSLGVLGKVLDFVYETCRRNPGKPLCFRREVLQTSGRQSPSVIRLNAHTAPSDEVSRLMIEKFSCQVVMPYEAPPPMPNGGNWGGGAWQGHPMPQPMRGPGDGGRGRGRATRGANGDGRALLGGTDGVPPVRSHAPEPRRNFSPTGEHPLHSLRRVRVGGNDGWTVVDAHTDEIHNRTFPRQCRNEFIRLLLCLFHPQQ
uniref:Uncharacterized protein n=1 Tax=Chromera velia CCMP2878 TaxID=1169474 RepID=A0A0G4HSZ2_9ALVE|eukprot:Cvel_8355.t1-p1 / transcript=Cvel_8355.t1 / gene=Cvel_8355 / organism=Chromera_velia_CCMP2878 / gene_product=hypothetical protein / transcript_product=hypothetical protein / location=Cvel_scaffold460:21042-22256(+) / protein_length=230 / sequence_SO=supercontig / SO=protein_coding / is_pseudo=false